MWLFGLVASGFFLGQVILLLFKSVFLWQWTTTALCTLYKFFAFFLTYSMYTYSAQCDYTQSHAFIWNSNQRFEPVANEQSVPRIFFHFWKLYLTRGQCTSSLKQETLTANWTQNLIFEIHPMKIKNFVKNRAKQTKLRHSKIIYLALEYFRYGSYTF